MPAAGANLISLPDESRPGLAVISNSVTPYRVHLHRLIVEGIPELKLHSLITHGDADFRWKVEIPVEINVTYFGRPGDSPLAGTFDAPLYEWRKGGRIIEYLRHNNVQAVVMLGHRYISYLRVLQYCHRQGMPIFVRNDSNIRSERALSSAEQFLKRRLYAWWIRRATGVFSMGRLGDQFFLKYGVNPRRLYRVPYWPDYDAFSKVELERLRQFREQYGLSPQRHYLLFSGRLVPVKRVDLLIDAFVRIADQRPEWDLLIVGGGVLEDDLRRRVPASLQARVIWTGFLEQQQLALAYHAVDVMVLPSDREPWAVVVQEAMAAGLIVIASDVVGAAHELLQDKSSGRIFPAGDLNQLTSALLDVTADGQLDRIKACSRAALKEYRETVNPVSEIRRALTDVQVLTAPEQFGILPR